MCVRWLGLASHPVSRNLGNEPHRLARPEPADGPIVSDGPDQATLGSAPPADWLFNLVMRLLQAKRVGRGAARAPGSLVRASTSSF
jgi:hypothetical protein